MEICLNTDYLSSTTVPVRYLKMLAEAGFTHVHWCHQWNTDYVYSIHEIREYKKQMKNFGLKLLDIHGSAGQEKGWCSAEEYRRKAGVELVENRMMMFAEMEGSGSLIMHPPCFRETHTPEQRAAVPAALDAFRRTMDDLIPSIEKYKVRIAIENLPCDTFEILPVLMKEYPAEWLGITFDTGHANMGTGSGLNLIQEVKDRIQALHLQDNDGAVGDQHQPPFYGKIDWEYIVKLLKESSYTNRPLSFELSMRNTPFYDPELKADQPEEKIREFLAETYRRCEKVVKMYQAC